MGIETIDGMLDAMEMFLPKARAINASDISFFDKKDKIMKLAADMGLA